MYPTFRKERPEMPYSYYDCHFMASIAFNRALKTSSRRKARVFERQGHFLRNLAERAYDAPQEQDS